MNAWPRVLLGELCKTTRAAISPDDKEYDNLPSVGLEQVESETGVITLAAGSRTGDGRSVNFRFDRRHVLYGKLRPYLNKVGVPDFTGRCSTELIPLLPAKGVERGFLAALLRRPATVHAVMSANTGSRMPRADISVLLGLEVPFPSLAEQRRTVDILDRAASIRRLRRQAQETAREIVPALFNRMFGDPRTNAKGLPVRYLGELLVDGPQNGLYRPATDYGRGTRILRIDSFYDGIVTSNLCDLRRLDIDAATVAKFELQPRDIVVNRVNSRPYLGKSAIIPEMDEPVVFESNMMRMTVDEAAALPEYVIAVLQLPSIRAALLSKAKDAINQSSINQQDVTSLEVLVPPLAQQAAFAALAATVHRTARRQSACGDVEDAMVAALQARLMG